MISPDHVRTMARYNRWQNRSLYGAADSLPDEARRQDRGAFFGSIFATLNHLLWADQMWMRRFSETPAPAVRTIGGSPELHADWKSLSAARQDFDQVIIDWARDLKTDDVEGDLSYYSGALQRQISKPLWLCMTHMFNHQTHHRGQAHAMLTALGARPEDTDLFAMPDDA